MKKIIFEGTATALVTPFKRGKIDYRAFDALIENQLRVGIDAFVVNGTTGECCSLSRRERRNNIKFVAEKVKGRVPIIAGTGCNNAELAKQFTEDASEEGADAVLAVTPYYNKTSEKGVVDYYAKLADVSDIPVLIYNVPGRTGMNLSPALIVELAKHENIVGIKQSDSDISRSAAVVELTDADFTLYGGNDDMITPFLAVGGKGIVSVASNAFPRFVSSICRDFFSGNVLSAAKSQLELLPLAEKLFSPVNPIPIKALLAHMNIIEDELRSPLVKLEKRYRKKLFDVAEKIREAESCKR